MKTGGAIASILGAMLLGGMGGGMFKGKGEDENEATKKLPSDDMTKVHMLKKQSVETPEAIDAMGSAKKAIDARKLVENQGLNPTFDNINRVSAGMLVDKSKDAPIPGASLSNEQLTGEPMPQAIKIPGLTSDANDTSLPSQPEDGSMAVDYMKDMGRVKNNELFNSSVRNGLDDFVANIMGTSPKAQEELRNKQSAARMRREAGR